MNKAELRRRVDEIDWFHKYEITPGVTSPGVYEPQIHLDRGCLPEDLNGRSVLDIGAWDGFFSFEAERRGAARGAHDELDCRVHRVVHLSGTWNRRNPAVRLRRLGSV